MKASRHAASAPTSPNRLPSLLASFSLPLSSSAASASASKPSLHSACDAYRYSLVNCDDDSYPHPYTARRHGSGLLYRLGTLSADSCLGRFLRWRWRWAAVCGSLVSLALSAAAISYVWYYSIYPHGHLCPVDLTATNTHYARLARHHLLQQRGYHLTPPRSITPHALSATQHAHTDVTRFRWDTRRPQTWWQRTTGSPARVVLVGLDGVEWEAVPAGTRSYLKHMLRMLQDIVDEWQPRHMLPVYMDILINTDYGDQLRDRNGSASNSTRPAAPPIFSSCSTLASADVPFVYAESWKSNGLYKMQEMQLLRTLAYVPEADVTLPTGERCMDVNKFTAQHWAAKASKAIWRGSTTGGLYTAANYDTYSRYQLAMLSRLNRTGLIDAKLTHCTQCEPTEEMERLLRDRLGGHFERDLIDAEQLTHYRGLIDVDGNSWSSRLPQLLASGAVVLKQASPYREFWYELVQTSTHWLEVARDLTDLEAVAEAAVGRGERGGEVAVNGLRFARQYLTEDAVRLYAQHLLTEYAALLEVPPVASSR